MANGLGGLGATFAGLAGIPAVTAVAAAFVGQAYLWTWGPYGTFQEMPTCQAERPCVLVAGLSNDVSYGFGANGQIFGMDMSDSNSEELVSALRGGLNGQSADIFRYPREVQIAGAGDPHERDKLANALRQARAAGQERHAQLVVIGRVVDNDTVYIAFVDPSGNLPQIAPLQYRLSNGDRQLLNQQFATALAAVTNHPAPPPLPAAPVADNSVASPQPISTNPPPRPTTSPSGTVPGAEDDAATHEIVEATVRDRPQPRDFQATYPRHALERGWAGQVLVRCMVGLDGGLHDCRVVSEDPPNRGFGAAALQLAEHHTTAFPRRVDTQPVADGYITVPYTFRTQQEH